MTESAGKCREVKSRHLDVSDVRLRVAGFVSSQGERYPAMTCSRHSDRLRRRALPWTPSVQFFPSYAMFYLLLILYVLVWTGMHWYALVCTGMYWYVLYVLYVFVYYNIQHIILWFWIFALDDSTMDMTLNAPKALKDSVTSFRKAWKHLEVLWSTTGHYIH